MKVIDSIQLIRCSRIATIREHQGWVVNVHQPLGAIEHPVTARSHVYYVWRFNKCHFKRRFKQMRIIQIKFRIANCFSIAGDIKFWDLRTFESTKTINVGNGLTTFEVHPYADVLAW